MVPSLKSESNNGVKYSCLIYSEGGRDSNFLAKLVELKKFKFQAKKWFFNLNHGSGSSPKKILDDCKSCSYGVANDLIVCFIDLDRLKKDSPKTWKAEQIKLEKEYPDITLFWQTDNAEDEYRKVLGSQCLSKRRVNNLASKQVEKFINSEYWGKLLRIIKDKEVVIEEKINKTPH